MKSISLNRLMKDSLDVQYCSNLVWHVIRRHFIAVPINKMDLFQIGFIGLLIARNKYKEGSVSFGSYAYHRIKGSIKDFLRKESKRGLVGFSGKKRDEIMEIVEFNNEVGKHLFVENIENRDSYLEMMLGLKERDKKIVMDYYFKDRTMKDIGREMGISEGRISQIISECLMKIKRKELINDKRNN